MIAEITAPQSKTKAAVKTLPSASKVAGRKTVCKPVPASEMGIQLIKGFKIPFTKAVTIAVKAEPMIIPTAKSITLPFVIKALKSLKSFFIVYIPLFLIYTL